MNGLRGAGQWFPRQRQADRDLHVSCWEPPSPTRLLRLTRSPVSRPRTHGQPQPADPLIRVPGDRPHPLPVRQSGRTRAVQIPFLGKFLDAFRLRIEETGRPRRLLCRPIAIVLRAVGPDAVSPTTPEQPSSSNSAGVPLDGRPLSVRRTRHNWKSTPRYHVGERELSAPLQDSSRKIRSPFAHFRCPCPPRRPTRTMGRGPAPRQDQVVSTEWTYSMR